MQYKMNTSVSFRNYSLFPWISFEVANLFANHKLLRDANKKIKT